MFNEFVAHPADFGFSNVSTPACGMEAVSIDCGAPGSGATWTYPSGSESTHLFADFAHPSSAAHAMLAQYAESIILTPGQISLLGEAPLATVTMLDRSVYNRAASRARDTESGGWRIWADFGSTHQRQDAQVNAPDGRSSFDQLSMGVDVQTKPTLTAGLVLTATRQESVLGGNAGSHDLDELVVTGYAAWRWQQIRVDGYTETGDDAATMMFGEQHRRALISTLDWQFDGTVQTGPVVLHPYARLAWYTDHEAEARAVRAGLVSMGGSFALPGFLPDRNWATATMGLNLDISSRLSAWLGYEARRADSSQQFNSINLGASWRF